MSSSKIWLLLTSLALASMGVVFAQERPAPNYEFLHHQRWSRRRRQSWRP